MWVKNATICVYTGIVLSFLITLSSAIHAEEVLDLDAALQKVVEQRTNGELEQAQALLTPLLDAPVDQIPVRLEQARLHAARGEQGEAIHWLHRTLNLGGNTAWPSVRDEAIFSGISAHDDYPALYKRMQPCIGGQFEQLAYIAGHWQVVSTGNPHGPKEHFNVTESIKGCAYFAEYGTTANYKYASLIFYDPKTDLWHQRGVDNQGFPMHMEGKMQKEELILTYRDGDSLYKSIFRNVSRDQMHNEIQRSKDDGTTWSRFFLGEIVRAD